MTKSQVEMDQLHGEQQVDYGKAKDDLEHAFYGVQKALEKVRAYYDGVAFVQCNFGTFMQTTSHVNVSVANVGSAL